MLQLHKFTSEILQQQNYQENIVVIEVLWKTVDL